MKYNPGDKVIVNTGGNDIKGTIHPKATALHGVYWEEQDCWSVQFENGSSQYIDAKYIKKATELHDFRLVSDYVADQLKIIPAKGRYPSAFQIRGAHYPPAGGYSETDTEARDVKTNWIDLTDTSANELIQWLRAEFRIFEDRYVVLQGGERDIAFLGTHQECMDYVAGNSKESLEKALDSDEWKIAHIDNYMNVE